MKKFSRKLLFLACAATLPLAAGCSSGQEPAPAAAIANPASEHCVKKGGKVEIVREEAGEKGMCHLPDGTVVEEWELFRRDNPEG